MDQSGAGYNTYTTVTMDLSRKTTPLPRAAPSGSGSLVPRPNPHAVGIGVEWGLGPRLARVVFRDKSPGDSGITIT